MSTEGPVRISVIEVCCSPASKLKEMTKVIRAPCLGLSEDMENDGAFRDAEEWARRQLELGTHLHVHAAHASTPCKSGSPLRRFGNASAETEQATQREWSCIMGAVERFLRLGHSRSFD